MKMEKEVALSNNAKEFFEKLKENCIFGVRLSVINGECLYCGKQNSVIIAISPAIMETNTINNAEIIDLCSTVCFCNNCYPEIFESLHLLLDEKYNGKSNNEIMFQ